MISVLQRVITQYVFVVCAPLMTAHWIVHAAFASLVVSLTAAGKNASSVQIKAFIQ